VTLGLSFASGAALSFLFDKELARGMQRRISGKIRENMDLL
jgi:hypothetical protein